MYFLSCHAAILIKFCCEFDKEYSINFFSFYLFPCLEFAPPPPKKKVAHTISLSLSILWLLCFWVLFDSKATGVCYFFL